MRVKALIITSIYILLFPFYIFASSIHEVDVKIEGTYLSDSLQKRVFAGIDTVTNHLLLGKDVYHVSSRHEEYEQIAKDIISRVLYGYTVEDLEIKAGSVTTVQATLKPYGPLVDEIHTVFTYGNLSSVGKEIVSRELSHIPHRVEQILQKVPVESLEWVRPVVQNVLRAEIESALPEFVAQVIISGDKSLSVDIFLIPHGEIIRETNVDIDSKTLPKILFYPIREKYERTLDELKGLPVNFVARHQHDLQKQIKESLSTSRATKEFKIIFEPELDVGKVTSLNITANSNRYIIRGAGYLDMGKQVNNVGINAHMGYLWSPRQEIYIETMFYPANYSWEPWFSYLYLWSKNTSVGYQYNLREKSSRLWFEHRIDNDWYIWVKHNLKDHTNELGIARGLHNYITFQYIFTEKDNWLRIIGHM